MNKIKFGDWLRDFKDVDRPIGDLATDMIRADDVEKFNNFTKVEDIPKELDYKVYVVAVETFNYYLVDSVEVGSNYNPYNDLTSEEKKSYFKRIFG